MQNCGPGSVIRYSLGLILVLLCATMPVAAQNTCSTGLDGAHAAEPSTITDEAEAKQHSIDLEGDKVERVSRFVDEKLAAWHVHELVHLELASLPRSEASRSSEERAVNQITGALLGLAQEK